MSRRPKTRLDGPGGSNGLRQAHACIAEAITHLEAAASRMHGDRADQTEELAERLRIDSERLEAIFGALVLRGGQS